MRTLAAVGVRSVDAEGTINSSVGVDGRYLTGSGGVNDIASVAAELLVVMKQSKGRMVDRVPFMQLPGGWSAPSCPQGRLRSRRGRRPARPYSSALGATRSHT